MTAYGRICSDIFKKEDIVKITTRTRLKSGAVPCLNPAPDYINKFKSAPSHPIKLVRNWALFSSAPFETGTKYLG